MNITPFVGGYTRTRITRYNILCAVLFLMACSLNGKEAPELSLKLLRPLPQAFTYSEHKDGFLYAVSCQSRRDGDEVGMMLIWRPNDGGKLVDVGSLSSLDEVLRSQVSLLGEHPDKDSVLRMITPALGEYVRLQARGFIIFPWECDGYMAQIKPHVPESIYQSVKERLVYPVESVTDQNWMVTVIVRKTDGAIELNRFCGSLSPFSIKKRDVDIIAGVGTIPNFHYVSPAPDSDGRQSERVKP